MFEKFIGTYLNEKLGVNNQIIYPIPHPLNCTNNNVNVIYDCVGISNSNDEEIIKNLVEYEKENKVF